MTSPSEDGPPSSSDDENEADDDFTPLLLVEQYAHRVLDYSSQYGSPESYSYTARNALGVPKRFPAYGEGAVHKLKVNRLFLRAQNRNKA